MMQGTRAEQDSLGNDVIANRAAPPTRHSQDDGGRYPGGWINNWHPSSELSCVGQKLESVVYCTSVGCSNSCFG